METINMSDIFMSEFDQGEHVGFLEYSHNQRVLFKKDQKHVLSTWDINLNKPKMAFNDFENSKLMFQYDLQRIGNFLTRNGFSKEDLLRPAEIDGILQKGLFEEYSHNTPINYAYEVGDAEVLQYLRDQALLQSMDDEKYFDVIERMLQVLGESFIERSPTMAKSSCIQSKFPKKFETFKSPTTFQTNNNNLNSIAARHKGHPALSSNKENIQDSSNLDIDNVNPKRHGTSTGVKVAIARALSLEQEQQPVNTVKKRW